MVCGYRDGAVKADSVDVVPQLLRLQHGDAAAPGANDAGPLELGEEAADRLARGAGELGEVGLVHLDRHLFGRVAVAIVALAAELGEDAGDAAGDSLEGLAGEAGGVGARAAGGGRRRAWGRAR